MVNTLCFLASGLALSSYFLINTLSSSSNSGAIFLITYTSPLPPGLVLLASYMGIYVSLRLDETFLTVLLPLSSAIYPLAYYRYNNIKDAGIAALKKPSSTFKSSGDSTVYLRPTERLGAWLIAGVVTPQDVTNLLESMSRLSNEC